MNAHTRTDRNTKTKINSHTHTRTHTHTHTHIHTYIHTNTHEHAQSLTPTPTNIHIHGHMDDSKRTIHGQPDTQWSIDERKSTGESEETIRHSGLISVVLPVEGKHYLYTTSTLPLHCLYLSIDLFILLFIICFVF